MMVNLRSRCVKNFKKNFATFYAGDQHCPLCGTELDSQEHALECHKVKEHMTQEELCLRRKVKYEHINGSTEEQANLASVYLSIVGIRERRLEEESLEQADQGIILDLMCK